MGADLAAIIVHEFAMLAHIIDRCAQVKAAGTFIAQDEADRLSKTGGVEFPEEYFADDDLDRLRESIDFNRLNDVWEVLFNSSQRLVDAFRNSHDPAVMEAEIATAARTICLQLSSIRLSADGRLTHPLLEKLWARFGCDAVK